MNVRNGNSHMGTTTSSCRRLMLLLGVLAGWAMLITPNTLAAKELRVSMAQLAVLVENQDKGVLVDLIKAMMSLYPDSTLKLSVSPFARSISNVTSGQADMHLPLIRAPSEQDLNFSFSKASFWPVNFVLYHHKDKPLDLSKLGSYQIETDLAHINYFDFKPAGSSNIPGSLRKLDLGRIDGFVYADSVTDPILKELGLKNIRRTLYKVFDVAAVLPKGTAEGPLDQMLIEGLAKLKADGRYQAIIGPVAQPYDNWQP